MNFYQHTIIPSLVSITTSEKYIRDFLMSENLAFYPSSSNHKTYSLSIHSVPEKALEQDFNRIGNYRVNDTTIHYKRHIMGPLSFDFTYRYTDNAFNFSPIYRYHFVNIGDIFTIGRHLFHKIERDLEDEGYFLVLSAAVMYRKKTYVVLAPNGSGKTHWVNTLLKQGASYISENFSVINPTQNRIYGIAPKYLNKGRKSNVELQTLFTETNIDVTPYSSIDKIFILRNASQKHLSKERLISVYLDTYTKYYLKNNFIRTLDFYHGRKNKEVLTKNNSFIQKKAEIISTLKEIETI